ncbi:MAG: ubiquinone/menaquinone biosynthesis C-methylase UbiE [Bacteroidia bacterium]|jgi:ubiquinone/menaquinone biosynthesis C-methylase UbiE
MAEENAYILGTDADELFRLGVQHQVWASEAHTGWALAGFTAGNTLLDLGCGPGFCSKELAFIAGNSGKVIGIDKSKAYIDFIAGIAKVYRLNIDAVEADFNDMKLEPNSIDGAYCRWALAWISNPEVILKKVYDALKPGGRFVIHEYFDWMTHQTVPQHPALNKCIKGCFDSFENFDGRINIGREIPQIAATIGYTVTGTRPMTKIAQRHELTWQWPITFYNTYFAKLVEMGYVTTEEMEAGFEDLKALEANPEGLISCPSMIEIIIEK